MASSIRVACQPISPARAYGLESLQVTVRHGAVFASFSPQVAPFADYLGPTMLTYFDRVFDGRALRLLGYVRQRIPQIGS